MERSDQIIYLAHCHDQASTVNAWGCGSIKIHIHRIWGHCSLQRLYIFICSSSSYQIELGALCIYMGILMMLHHRTYDYILWFCWIRSNCTMRHLLRCSLDHQISLIKDDMQMLQIQPMQAWSIEVILYYQCIIVIFYPMSLLDVIFIIEAQLWKLSPYLIFIFYFSFQLFQWNLNEFCHMTCFGHCSNTKIRVKFHQILY